MRRSSLAVALVSSLSFTAAGCRQTTGINAGGPLTPIGPTATTQPNGTLSPLGTGQSPALGPFGGNTRVTPPSTGSYVVPNNYMGGAAASPSGSASYPSSGFTPGQAPASNGLAPAANRSGLAGVPNQAVGSGLAVTGWTDSGSATQPNLPATNQFQRSATRDPRSGGMQVTDLTGNPPRPPYIQPTNPGPFNQPNVNQPNVNQPSFNQPNGFGQPAMVPQGGGQQAYGQQAYGQQRFTPPGNFSQPTTAPRPAAAPPQLAPVPRPSTEPISSPVPQLRPIDPPPRSQIATEPDATSNLQWRRPGTF